MASDETIDTGDTVFHAPTGETWVVAYVRDGRLAWVGWPEGEAQLSDCTLVEKAPASERLALLNDLAAMRPTDSGRLDARCSYARAIIAAQDTTSLTTENGNGE